MSRTALLSATLLFLVLTITQINEVSGIFCKKCANCTTEGDSVDCNAYAQYQSDLEYVYSQNPNPHDFTDIGSLTYACLKMTDSDGTITRSCASQALCNAFGGVDGNVNWGKLTCCQSDNCNSASTRWLSTGLALLTVLMGAFTAMK